MQATYLPPVAAPKFTFSAKVFVLLLASGLTSHLVAAQATAPSPAAAAANADMLSWMLIAFTTSRRVDARPLAPAQTPAAPAEPAAAMTAEVRAATTSERLAA
jgi:hypothetical protein